VMSGVGGDDNRKEEMFAKQRNFYRENKKYIKAILNRGRKLC